MSAPTATQKRLWQKIVYLGCMACLQDGIFSDATIHHWREYGYRDHSKVFGLCPAHHLYQDAVEGTPNREKNKLEFQKKYGTDFELFTKCMEMIK